MNFQEFSHNAKNFNVIPVSKKLFADSETPLTVYQKLAKQYPNNAEYLFEEADLLLVQNKLSDAIRLYDQIENIMGVTPELIQQKEKLYLKLGDVKGAAGEIEKLINFILFFIKV